MVPTQYVMTMSSPGFDQYDLSSLQLLISAGSPLMKDTKEQILQRFPCALSELYGLTEGIATIVPPEMVRAVDLDGLLEPYTADSLSLTPTT